VEWSRDSGLVGLLWQVHGLDEGALKRAVSSSVANTAGTARKELERCPWVIKDHSTESLPGIGDHQQATGFAIVSAPGIPGQPSRSSAAATAVIYFVAEHRAPAQQSMPSEQGSISGQHNRTWLMISSDNSYL
jgi:hypothetical protein